MDVDLGLVDKFTMVRMAKSVLVFRMHFRLRMTIVRLVVLVVVL